MTLGALPKSEVSGTNWLLSNKVGKDCRPQIADAKRGTKLLRRPRSTSPVPGVTAEELLDGCACFDRSFSSRKPVHSTTTATDLSQETITASMAEMSNTDAPNTNPLPSATADGNRSFSTDGGETQTTPISTDSFTHVTSTPTTTTPKNISCATPASAITTFSHAAGDDETIIQTWTLALNTIGTTLSGTPDTNTTFNRALNASEAATSCVSYIDNAFDNGAAGNALNVFQDEALGDAWHCISFNNHAAKQFSNDSFVADDFAECSYGYILADSHCEGGC
ncbi:hypothetical protein ANO11243_093750 [Dothideomycetidae sp. 11243]|nr:hypothetical protein ANO11243_093750 [fungal sp. No.11243]